MAKVALDLNRYKASGVYTIEYDANETVVVTNQTIRLIVGFSRKGPFNTPVFLRDQNEARRVYGGIDNFLESKGSFFHRSLETCLQTSPVFALALLPLNNMPINQGGDATEYKTFSLDSSVQNGEKRKALVSSFFNQERFWKPDQEYLQATVDSKPADAGRLLSFVNLSQDVQSIIIRKSVNANRYNITAKEYFENGEIPPYIYEFDYLSDYFIDVYIVKGDWSNLSSLSQDPIYSKYFDSRGIIVSQLENFLSLDGVTMTGAFTGTIIPDFIDNNNVNQSIDRIINNATALTGIYCTINKQFLESEEYQNSKFKVDMIGNNLVDSDVETIEFLSYSSPIKSVLKYQSRDIYDGLTYGNTYNISLSDIKISSRPIGGEIGKLCNLYTIKKPSPLATGFTIYDYEEIRSNIKVGSRVNVEGTSELLINDFLKVYDIIDTGDSLTLVLGSDTKIYPGFSAFIDTSINYIGGAFSTFVIEGKIGNGVIPVNNNIVIELPNNVQTINPGDVILIEYPGYSGYFEVLTADGTAAPIWDITIKSVAGTPTAPYFQDNYIKYNIETDEFGINPNPNDFKLTVFKTSGSASGNLIPSSTILTIDYEYNACVQGVPAVVLGNQGWRNPNSTPVNNKFVPWNSVKIYDSNNIEIISADAGFFWIITSAGIDEIIIQQSNNITTSSPNPTTPFVSGNVYKFILQTGETIYMENSLPTLFATPNPTLGLADVSTLWSIEFTENSKVGQDWKKNKLVSGDRVKYGAGANQFVWVKYSSQKRSTKPLTMLSNTNSLILKQFSNQNLTNIAKDANIASLNQTYINNILYNILNNDFVEFAIYSSLGKEIFSSIPLRDNVIGNGKQFILSATNANKLQIGDYVVSLDENGQKHLVKVVSKISKFDPLAGENVFEYEILSFPDVSILSGVNYITKFVPIQNFVERLVCTPLYGFKITDYHLPGSNSQLEKILGVIENTNIGKTLADKDAITFRYIVDTFNGGLAPGMGAKQILTRLAKRRQKCLAFINMPTIKEFMNSTDPRFTDLPQPNIGVPRPLLQTKYIVEGGNLSLGPSFRFTLPDEENGAKYMGTFSPNMIIREDNKDKSIPLAADISNNFIRKFILGEPYSIVAGTRRGVISNPKFVRMEYDYLLSDREYLEPSGINPVVNISGVGPMIYANQTAFQRKLSPLNNLHVRDLLITIEIAIEEILQNYLFEFNDVATRQEISSILNSYLDGVRNAGGVTSYSVVMNDKNNTPELIGQNFGLVDVEIEPAYGIQKFINRVTLKRTGGALSGGFVTV